MSKRTYTTLEVSEKTGATLRQLQWWDETGYIKATRVKGWRRNYSLDQLKQVQRIMEIRQTFKMRFRDIPAHGRVRIITGPTEIGGILVIPRKKQYR